MNAAVQPRVVVTGANGYVGGAIAGALEARGWRVDRWSRAAGFTLGAPTPAAMFGDGTVDVLIHCGYDFAGTTWADVQRVNVDGSLRLFDDASNAGVPQRLFISSLAAYQHSASWYGRGKWLVERGVLARGGHAIRPGTIFGPRPGGMMGALAAQVASARWLPAVHHPRTLRLTHEDDLSALVAEIVADKCAGGVAPWLAAADRTWRLETLLKTMAQRQGRRLRVVPVPWQLAWIGLRSLEAVGVRGSFRSDSVLSLGRPAPADEIRALRVPATKFRDFDL